jgi:glutamyl/glutaminyl-tRNA synthetase
LASAEADRRLEAGERAAIRFRVGEEAVRFEDGLRGETGQAGAEIGDFVVCRDDGRPTYNLACVVDDHSMRIDHVIRGEDHLSNTPRQILLYRALGWAPPAFTHLPLVLGPDRTRLSKRHGAVSVGELRAQGVVPAALANYLALLGGATEEGDEAFDLRECAARFDVSRLTAVNAVFDVAKLDWLGARHLARMQVADVLDGARRFFEGAGLGSEIGDPAWWLDAVELVAGRCRRFTEVASAVASVAMPDLSVLDAVAVDAELAHAGSRAALEELAAASDRGELTTEAGFRAAARSAGEGADVRGRELFHPLRLATTGRDGGPELARLVPLIERGAVDPRRSVPSVAERIRRVLAAGGPGDG